MKPLFPAIAALLLMASCTNLHEAVRQGDVQEVTDIVDDGDAIDRGNDEGRTPLMLAVRAGRMEIVDLLLENAGPNLAEGDRELLQAAHDEVHRMQALVNDLLDLSKIEAGHIDLEYERATIETLFGHAEDLFRPRTERKGVRLETTLDEALPAIRADANKVVWVLSNLISNALRYVDRGGRIGLTARGMGSFVHLSVADDGPGIPPEYQSRIFDKLVQIKGREPGGSGLGLAICKEIVRAHGGAIWVESRPGEGSAFTFTLPALS